MQRTRKTKTIFLTLPLGMAEGLELAAAQQRINDLERMIVRVLRQFLLSREQGIDLPPLPADLSQCSPEQMKDVEFRLAVLTAWEIAQASGKGSCEAIVRRLATYYGIDLSCGTMHNWRRRLAKGGAVGLADARRIKRVKKTV